MKKTEISAEIVADSIDSRGNRITSLLITFPRIILSEINTHRMLSKNTSSSRAIPFKKMVEAVQNDPFIPIAWQKSHSGMQGSEYFTDIDDIKGKEMYWLTARSSAINMAQKLHNHSTTKQLCNRLLEPFMWTTMLITGSKEGWDNFFELRCPYYWTPVGGKEDNGEPWRYFSKKDCMEGHSNEDNLSMMEKFSELDWLKINKGQAEIHIMMLSEKIYDVMNESTPKQLKAGEWHIPLIEGADNSLSTDDKIKYSVGRAANTSYTVVGDGKRLSLEQAVKIHDKCKELNHSSVFEHCARAMTDEEYKTFIKGKIIDVGCQKEIYDNGYECSMQFTNDVQGWSRNFKGFIQYRHIIENS